MIKKNLPLASFTTFHIGGPAHSFIEVFSEKDVQEASSYARSNKLKLFPLGGGSNILVPDAGVDGVVVRIALSGIEFSDHGDSTVLIAGAGVPWEEVVEAALARDLFGIENLAGIPGTVGGATVQNIGAYGVELEKVFEYADVIDATNGELKRITRNEAKFGYRTSYFKEHRELILIRVVLCLTKDGLPHLTYPDLLKASASGKSLKTPQEIAQIVRSIRAEKFPQRGELGTAGSFFKNPILSKELVLSLEKRFPGLPVFPQSNGSVKISLAWVLDHVLSLKGFSIGGAELYKKHSLVLVAEEGTTAAEVDTLARAIENKIFDALGIKIEREVETFGAR